MLLVGGNVKKDSFCEAPKRKMNYVQVRNHNSTSLYWIVTREKGTSFVYYPVLTPHPTKKKKSVPNFIVLVKIITQYQIKKNASRGAKSDKKN